MILKKKTVIAAARAKPAKVVNFPQRQWEGQSEAGLENVAVTDRAFWLDDPITEAWVRALEAIDKKGDHRQLISLLQSDFEMTPAARLFLADLHDRMGRRGRRGRPRTPDYERTAKEAILKLACEEVHALVYHKDKSKRMREAQALEHVIERYKALAERYQWKDRYKPYDIQFSTLKNAYNGRRGGTHKARRDAARRMKKDRP